MLNKMFICMFFSWAPNYFAIEAIEHCIKSSFRGPYHHYDAMTEEDQLKWWTDFKVI